MNLNALRHVNRVLGSDFEVRQWQHRAIFNTDKRRIEMHLVARTELTVHWSSGERRFAKGEHIHTENSYKYTVPAAVNLLQQAGFANTRHWTDPSDWFSVIYARAV